MQQHPEHEQYQLAPPIQRGEPMPDGVRVFRMILMWSSAAIAVIYMVFLVALTLPASLEYGSQGLQNVGLIIWVGLFALLATAAYLIGHLAYGIFWLLSVRGRGYKPSGLTTALLIGAPGLVGLVFFGGIFLTYFTAGAFRS